MEIEIKRVNTPEECAICDEFLNKLVAFESQCDEALLNQVSLRGVYEQNMNHPHAFIAYAKADMPLGYIFGYLKNPKGLITRSNVIILEAIFIEEEYRRQGIGTKLLAALEDWAHENFGDDYELEITAINNNELANAFYKKHGCSAVKVTYRK